jgi:prepilin-type N-terminal cleavage/methylation domain-containing protein
MPLVYPHPRHSPGRPGFTLMELLTVISIIAVLAGLLWPVVGAAMRQANKSRTLMLFNGISNAFEQYRQEYGRYPIFPELTATATPWTTNKNEVDYSFLLNDGDSILRKVLTADNAYLAASSTPGAKNYNRNGIVFLSLDETFLTRDKPDTTASNADPLIQDGFKNVNIGMVVHTGDNQEIDAGAFSTAKAVPDSEDNGALVPKVTHNLPQRIAIYSLVTDLDDDPVNSPWVTNWPYAQYNN